MKDLPDDAFWACLEYLANDGVAIGRLSLCSSGLYEKINNNAKLWKLLYHSRWTTRIPLDELNEGYRIEYHRRHNLDQRATKILFEMTEYLQQILKLKDDIEYVGLFEDIVEQAWDHPSRETLFGYRDEIADVLRVHARQNRKSCTIYQRLLGFLACRFLRDIEFIECLFDWEQLTLNNTGQIGEQNLILMECYNILICQTQQTPEEQLDISKDNLAKNVTSQLDEIADKCLQRIKELSIKENEAADVLLLVNDILLNEYHFSGNVDNYYDYRNSLLSHVLVTKKGIPITLCLLFACVCRRLKLHTFLVGLPGHVVLGFQDNTNMDKDDFRATTETLYLDVFHTGKVLSVEDCKRICNSYDVPWNDQFLQPLTASQVFDRTFNNLDNCHVQSALLNSVTVSPFRSELYVQKNGLEFIHSKAKSVNEHLVRSISKELSCHSPELLIYYGLTSLVIS